MDGVVKSRASREKKDEPSKKDKSTSSHLHKAAGRFRIRDSANGAEDPQLYHIPVVIAPRPADPDIYVPSKIILLEQLPLGKKLLSLAELESGLAEVHTSIVNAFRRDEEEPEDYIPTLDGFCSLPGPAWKLTEFMSENKQNYADFNDSVRDEEDDGDVIDYG